MPPDQLAWQRFLSAIRAGFERFGFLPIETPVFELTDVLLSKSGGETEKQIYLVQSSAAQAGQRPDLALRFDLTVPLARYVARYETALTFPFRRYQMQRVYRGERPQRGRFREFMQCDVDVVARDRLPLGSDAEMPAVIASIFEQLAVGRFTIGVSNRRLLRGLLTTQGIGAERQPAVLRQLDKLRKIGADATRAALTALGLADREAGELLDLLAAPGANAELLGRLDAAPANDDLTRGLSELREVLDGMAAFGVREPTARVDLTMVRGLDYYTGTVFETFLEAAPGIGSVCSGGRYDDLASRFTKSRLPGVGLSIGATRLFQQLKEAGLIPSATGGCDVFVVQLDWTLVDACRALATRLRAAGVRTELAPEPAKVPKQLAYADKLGARFVLFLGAAEAAKGVATVKELATRVQVEVEASLVVEWLATRVERR